MIALSVNLNKIALIRNSRAGQQPDVGAHAQMAIRAGADGITVHPRPDQRHIRAADCFDLAGVSEQRSVRSGRPLEFNIEGNPFAGPCRSDRAGVGDYPGFMPLLREIRPQQCTLVPDGADQLTSDHGFDLQRDGARLAPLLAELRALGIRSSLFLAPEPQQIRLAAGLGADRIELFTASWAQAWRAGAEVNTVYRRFQAAAACADELGLGVNAGHDLDLHNLPHFSTLPGLLEVSIGHALIIDALHMGLAATIAAYHRALGNETAQQT